jgi:hypothetical protein
MTYEEARALAIQAGALEPQGFGENVACNLKKSENWSFQWSQTPRAQARLAAWTDAILNGIPSHELRRRIG